MIVPHLLHDAQPAVTSLKLARHYSLQRDGVFISPSPLSILHWIEKQESNSNTRACPGSYLVIKTSPLPTPYLIKLKSYQLRRTKVSHYRIISSPYS